MARIKSAAHAYAAAVAHATDAAVHAADTARSASAATRSAAAAVAAAARDSCPASTEPEEDTEIDLELGTHEFSSTSSSSSSTPSSPSSSSISTLSNLKEMFGWFDSWSDIISEVVLTSFMGGPIYPSYKLISKKAEPQYMLFFILYCCIWICISTCIVFVFLGRSKKEKSLSLWMQRLYMMADCISMVIYIWALIPNTYGVNLGAGILIYVVVFSHMTAWNISLPNSWSSNESDNDLRSKRLKIEIILFVISTNFDHILSWGRNIVIAWEALTLNCNWGLKFSGLLDKIYFCWLEARDSADSSAQDDSCT